MPETQLGSSSLSAFDEVIDRGQTLEIVWASSYEKILKGQIYSANKVAYLALEDMGVDVQLIIDYSPEIEAYLFDRTALYPVPMPVIAFRSPESQLFIAYNVTMSTVRSGDSFGISVIGELVTSDFAYQKYIEDCSLSKFCRVSQSIRDVEQFRFVDLDD